MNTSLGPTSPPAVRAATPGWRDPRLWIGIAIVAVSVVAGTRLMAGADDSISVWAVSENLAPGAALATDQLTARRVRFAEPGDAELYLRTDETLPADSHLLRGVGSGELLPRAALGAAGDTGIVQLPIGVSSRAVPPGVDVGDRVDVYVSDPAAQRREAERVLIDVVVVAAPGVVEELGSSGDRQLVLGVPVEDADDLTAVIGAAAQGTVTVVGLG